jgi:hypothetical protein
VLELAYGDAEFLGGLAADCGGRVVGAEQSGGGLDEPSRRGGR